MMVISGKRKRCGKLKEINYKLYLFITNVVVVFDDEDIGFQQRIKFR